MVLNLWRQHRLNLCGESLARDDVECVFVLFQRVHSSIDKPIMLVNKGDGVARELVNFATYQLDFSFYANLT